MRAPGLLDEVSGPRLRAVWGGRLARARAADVAVTRVRLATLDFSEREVARVRRLRVVVAELSAFALDGEARALRDTARGRAALERILALLEEGRVAVRSAPLGGWSPDFTVFHGAREPRLALVGPHRFEPAGPLQGPLFVSIHGRRGAERAARRFEALWERGHDVRSPVRDVLARARPGGEPRRPVAPEHLVRQRFARPSGAWARLDTPLPRD